MEMKLLTDADGTKLLRCAPRNLAGRCLPLADIYEGIERFRRRHPGLERIAIDLRGVIDFDFGRQEGDSIRNSWRRILPGNHCLRAVILVDHDLVFGLCRMYHSLVHEGRDCINIFRDPDAAAAWLGLVDPAVLAGDPGTEMEG
jgi:hypothetical protein